MDTSRTIDGAAIEAEAIRRLHAKQRPNGRRSPPELVPVARVAQTVGADASSATDADGFIRVGALVAEPDTPHPWVVHGLVLAGGMTLIAGKPKAGKSTLARAVALRVARGEPVLGRDTMQGPVLYLGLEDPRDAIKGHFQRMGATTTDDLHVYTGRVPEHAQLWLAEQRAKRDPVLVVIDTMQFFLGIAEINEYGQVVNALRSILDLFRGTRCAVLVTHHAGKGDRQAFDAILGSTGILGTVDTAILVKRRPDDQSRTIATMQRMHAPGGEDMPETVLTLDDHTEPTLAGTREQYDLDHMADRMLAHLTTQPDWVEYPAWLDAVEGNKQQKIKAATALFGARRVERQGGGKKNNPFLFRIPFCGSPPTPRTTERNPERATSSSHDATNTVPASPEFLAVPPSPENGNGGARTCPKGHPMRHGAGVPLDHGWVCPTCYPDAATALGVGA